MLKSDGKLLANIFLEANNEDKKNVFNQQLETFCKKSLYDTIVTNYNDSLGNKAKFIREGKRLITDDANKLEDIYKQLQKTYGDKKIEDDLKLISSNRRFSDLVSDLITSILNLFRADKKATHKEAHRSFKDFVKEQSSSAKSQYQVK